LCLITINQSINQSANQSIKISITQSRERGRERGRGNNYYNLASSNSRKELKRRRGEGKEEGVFEKERQQ